MKVLHLLSTNRLSGAENVAADICMMFEEKHELMYCSPVGPIQQALWDRGVNYFPLKAMSYSEIRRAVMTFKPDIIHAHDVRATVFAVWLSGRRPVISHLHGNVEDMRKIGFKPILYLLASKKLKKVITVSASCLTDYIFKRQIEKKTFCLRNIIYTFRIEMLMSKEQKDYNFDFVYIGRLSYPKNPQRVARVASAVLKKYKDLTFGVIGDGESKSEMEAIFKYEGVSDRVTFTGQIAYPYKALKQSKCMLMCSRFEGTPIAVLEAMALGVPIVSTPVDGICDLIEHNNNGYLSDEDDELATYVSTIINDERIYNVMSNKTKDKFQKVNDIDMYKNKIQECYLR